VYPKSSPWRSPRSDSILPNDWRRPSFHTASGTKTRSRPLTKAECPLSFQLRDLRRAHGRGRDAPIPDLPVLTPERGVRPEAVAPANCRLRALMPLSRPSAQVPTVRFPIVRRRRIPAPPLGCTVACLSSISKRAYSRLTLVNVAENRSSARRSIRHTDEIEVVKLQLARIPTRAYFSRMLLPDAPDSQRQRVGAAQGGHPVVSSGKGASAFRLSLGSAQASLLKPHAGPAVADVTRVEENNVGTIESFLNCG
jgi:hypothetical protein